MRDPSDGREGTRAPVVFLIFNRPDTTARVFKEIARARPNKLLVVADGPRADRPGEATQCELARRIIDRVDWPCEVLSNYADTNLGCKRRVSSGLDWAFGLVSEAIILEDDCVPDQTFFRFCDELLERFRDDERIMAVSGDDFQFGLRRSRDSYYFSRYAHCWGWASWRRAWNLYDHEMTLWPTVRDGRWLDDILHDQQAVQYWTRLFQATYEGQIDSWAYRWLFACWIQSGLAVLPNTNLVTNIGFTANATHTTVHSRLADIPLAPMSFPLQHPAFVLRDALADSRTQKRVFEASRRLVTRVARRSRRWLGGLLSGWARETRTEDSV